MGLDCRPRRSSACSTVSIAWTAPEVARTAARAWGWRLCATSPRRTAPGLGGESARWWRPLLCAPAGRALVAQGELLVDTREHLLFLGGDLAESQHAA